MHYQSIWWVSGSVCHSPYDHTDKWPGGIVVLLSSRVLAIPGAEEASFCLTLCCRLQDGMLEVYSNEIECLAFG